MFLKLVNIDDDPNNVIYLESVKFFLNELLGAHTCKQVSKIFIKVNAHMYDMGECSVRQLKNNKISIRIKFSKKNNFIDSLITLAHECIHAKQFVKHELMTDKTWIWKGKDYGNDPYITMHYKKLPWEKEAYKKETSLTIKYLNHYFSKMNDA